MSTANEALNTSTEAMRIAEEALDIPDSTAQQVDQLEQEYAVTLLSLLISCIITLYCMTSL